MAGVGHNTAKWILIAILALPVGVASYNVLFMMPLGTRSHKNALYPIAEELGKKGHKVTFYSTLAEKTTSENVQDVVMNQMYEMNTFLSNFSFFIDNNATLFNMQAMQSTHSMLCALLEAMFSDPFVQDLVLHPRVINGSSKSLPRYDIIVVDALFNEFSLPIAHHLGAPIVYVSPSILPFTLAWSMNIPNPPYLPSLVLFVDGPMSFWDRAFTVLTNFVMANLRLRYQLPSFDARIREYLPNAPTIRDIERNVSFLLTSTHYSINPSAPSMPYHADVGGLHCKPAKKLPKDLEDFMQSSGDDGVIYFAFGSIQPGQNVPQDMKKKFLTVFTELPQNVLWKHETDLEDLPSNVKLIDWAPQQDILGHPKVRLFISHGGGLSIQETSYHGKPVLAFPLGVEQHSNVGNVVRLGFGEHLDWRTFSTEDLRVKIKQLLEDPKYTENAQRVSRRFRDRPERPIDLAVYWIEYVVRHDGAHYLKSRAEDLNFFQYFALDIISAVIIVIFIVAGVLLLVAVLTVRKLISCLPTDKLTGVLNNVIQSVQLNGKVKKN